MCGKVPRRGCWPYIRPGWPLERARKPSNPAISRHQWQGFLVYGRRPGILQAYHSATGAVLLAEDRRENPGAGAHVAVFAASLDSWADPPAVHPQPSRPGEADEQCRATAASSQSRLNQEVLLRTTSVVVILLLSLACSTAAAPTPVSTPAPALEPTPVPIAAPMPTPTPTAMSVSPVTPSPPPIAASPTDRGLTITPENRCSPYDPDDYRYSQSVEPRIVASMGGTVYGPYTGRVFSSTRETDIEHIVARSEAHDSGLCEANPETRNRFASDPLNLTLAAPSVNRHQKSSKDVAEWLPDLNECWFVDRVVQVKRKYGLTVDRAEATAIESVLAECASVEMVMSVRASPPVVKPTQPQSSGAGYASCDEARAAGESRVQGSKGTGRGFPKSMVPSARDGDGDGVVCER